METILREAYKIIFNKDPKGLEDWQVADELLEGFDVPKLGEELAKECIHKIVNYIDYPDRETQIKIVGRAEGLAKELWDELPDEPHMNEIRHLEYSDKNKRR